MKNNICLSKTRGFSILELMLAVGLLSVLVGLSAPSLSNFLQRQSVKADAQLSLKSFNAARAAAPVVDEKAALVCWNTGNSDIDISDGTVTHTIAPGYITAMEGDTVSLGGIISSNLLSTSDTVAVFDNDGDDCIGFDFQGRMTGSDNNTFGFAYCRDDDDTRDARRVEVSASGRVTMKLNTNTTGIGEHACT